VTKQQEIKKKNLTTFDRSLKEKNRRNGLPRSSGKLLEIAWLVSFYRPIAQPTVLTD